MLRSKQTQVLTRAVLGVALTSGGLLTFASRARANLTIVPTFTSSITSDPNAATIEATINTAISNIESYIANPVTVSIDFAEMSTGLGHSQTFISNRTYTAYLAALETNQTLSTDDNVALATLPAGPDNPVDGNTEITATLPLLRALGFSANPPAGDPDSTISFNAGIVNDSRPGTNPSDFDLESTIAHEMDEVLGIGGAGSQLNAVLAGTSSGSVGPLDLFRYSGPNTRSYSTSPSVSSYFSINNGTTDFVHFNQDNNGSDYADWGDGVTPADGEPNTPAQVQDAFGNPGDTAAAEPNLGPNEMAALDVVGWNLTSAGVALEAQVGPAALTWNNTGGSGDGIHWDTTSQNWNNGSGPAVFTNASNVTFNDTNNGHYAVTLNTTVSPGSVTVNNSSGNYSISGTGTIGGTGSLTKSGSDTLTLSTQNTYTGGTNVSAGVLLIEPTSSTTSALPKGALSITGGEVQLASNVTAGSQSANVPTSAPTSNVNLTSLSITGSGKLDIGNNHIIIDYSGTDPIASIAAWIASGYNGGTWTGTGITSSAAASNSKSYGIGYADAADTNNPAGLSDGQIEIMYTLLGDANLDGKVNGIDFNLMATNFNQAVTDGWDKGDFNYDGKVNGIDFNLLATNFNQLASQSATSVADAAALDAFASANGLLDVVPEPGSLALGLSLVGFLSTVRRCRR